MLPSYFNLTVNLLTVRNPKPNFNFADRGLDAENQQLS